MTSVMVAFREEHAPALAGWLEQYHSGDGDVRSTEGGWRAVTVDIGESGGPGQQWDDMVTAASAAGLTVEGSGPGALRLVPQSTVASRRRSSRDEARLLAVPPQAWGDVVSLLASRHRLAVTRLPFELAPVWITSPIEAPIPNSIRRDQAYREPDEAQHAARSWDAAEPEFSPRRVSMGRDLLPAVHEWLDALAPGWTPRAAGNTYDDPRLRWFEVDDPAIWASLVNLAAERGWSLAEPALGMFTLEARHEPEA